MFTYIKTLITILKKMIDESKQPRCNVLQEWVEYTTPRSISTLLSALRGSDINNGSNTKEKEITKMIRNLVCYSYSNKTGYMFDKVITRDKVINILCDANVDNPHWVSHIIGAARVIGHNHPNNYIRDYWKTIYHTTKNRLKRKENVMNDMIKIKENNNLVALHLIKLIDKANEKNSPIRYSGQNILAIGDKDIAKIIKKECIYETDDFNLYYELYVSEEEILSIDVEMS